MKRVRLLAGSLMIAAFIEPGASLAATAPTTDAVLWWAAPAEVPARYRARPIETLPAYAAPAASASVVAWFSPDDEVFLTGERVGAWREAITPAGLAWVEAARLEP